jgi:hypothetical protein
MHGRFDCLHLIVPEAKFIVPHVVSNLDIQCNTRLSPLLRGTFLSAAPQLTGIRFAHAVTQEINKAKVPRLLFSTLTRFKTTYFL